ncbi:hypothetical protein [Bradyrhizobium lablabi]|nr:hypothetical protein [Bradyrhizobium lablabi]
MRHTTTKGAISSRLSMRGALPMLHAAGAVLLVIAVAGPARAQSTGIAACDDFLTKYDTCVTSKLPEAQRATYKAQLDQTRKTWLDMAKNPSTKPAMEQSCKQTMDAMKASLQTFGCTF